MRKKLFAVIMSAMMMITFMPTMAFAASYTVNAQIVSWGANYEGAYVDLYTTTAPIAKVKSNVWLTSTRDWNTANNGSIDATLASSKVIGDDTYTFDNAASLKATYFDFAGATVVGSDGSENIISANQYVNMIDQTSEVSAPKFKSGFTAKDVLGSKIKFVKPSYLPAASTASQLGDYDALIGEDKACDIDVELQKYQLYDNVSYLTFPVVFTQNHANNNGGINAINLGGDARNHKVYLGVDNVKSIKVKMAGAKEQPYTVGSSTTITTHYCAADQAFTVTNTGVTVKYSNDFGVTWGDKAPEMVKAGDYKFMIKVSKTGVDDAIGTVKVKVEKNTLDLLAKKALINLEPGKKATPANVASFKVRDYADELSAYKSVDVFEADKAMAKTIFDKYVILTDSFPTQNSMANYAEDIDDDEVCIDFASLLKDSKTDKDLAAFLENYGLNDDDFDCDVTYAAFGNDITAPNKTVTCKSNKKKVYTLKAKADYGTCTYTKMNTAGGSKIKVAKSGKVTIKKGLKKKTYSVKIKVKAPGAKATMTLKVKVK